VALSDGVKQRVIGLCTGTVEPVTELEDELCSAFVGRVAPRSPIVRQWYDFVMHIRAEAEAAADRAAKEQGKLQYAHAALRESLERREIRGDMPLLRAENAQLREVIDHQRQHIQALMRRIDDLESRPPSPVSATANERDDVGEACPICHGEGGIRNGCYKCGGTGWIR
jgi:predicted nuclease with TOPRIM domain